VDPEFTWTKGIIVDDITYFRRAKRSCKRGTKIQVR
jgi:hypothetical protein